MGEIEAINYIRQTSGSYVMGYDRRIKEMFEDFDKDKDGILSFQDFYRYNISSIMGAHSYYYKKKFIEGL